MSIVQFKNVSKIYSRNSVAIDGVNFKVEPEEFVSIVGRSGSGKTTILRLLIGEETPTSGRVFFKDQEVVKIPKNNIYLLRRKIGMIFQDFKLLPQKTVFENVAFAIEAEGLPQSDIEEYVPKILELVGLAGKEKNFPQELSGGEQQRTAIARAMIQRPELILADEPTGNLDPITSQEILRLLLKINELGTTIILASHAKDVVNKIGRRVITLDQGKIVLDEIKGKYTII